MELVALISALQPATMKQKNIISIALMLIRPSGRMLWPSRVMPSRNIQTLLVVPSGPNRCCTITVVSTQSRKYSGPTSQKAMSMNQKPENRIMYQTMTGRSSSLRLSRHRLIS